MGGGSESHQGGDVCLLWVLSVVR